MSAATIAHVRWVKLDSDGKRALPPPQRDGGNFVIPHPKVLPNRPRHLKPAIAYADIPGPS